MVTRRLLPSTGAAVLALAVSGAVPGAHLEAQQGVQVRATRAPAAMDAWLGVSLQMSVQQGADGTHTGITVTRVEDDGPADLAGLRAGDRVVRVNGRPASLTRFQQVYERLRPGDHMSLTLIRNGGRRQDVLVTAAPRPASFSFAIPGALAARIDSALERMDSLQHATEDSRLFTGTLRLMVEGRRDDDVEPDEASSFRAFVFRTTPDGYATLDRQGLEDAFLEARTAEADYLQALASRTGPRGRIDPNDPELVRLRERRVAVGRALQDRPPEDAAARARVVTPFPPRDPVAAQAPPRTPAPDPEGPVRAFLPWVAGQNRVAGAELTPMNPELASYFQVEEGLLVTEVIEGTPAADAGLRPGDVVTRLDGRPVRTLDELRSGLRRTGSSEALLTVVRRGRQLQVRLPR